MGAAQEISTDLLTTSLKEVEIRLFHKRNQVGILLDRDNKHSLMRIFSCTEEMGVILNSCQ